jgi:vacuolar protein sorting-associated protein 72
MTQEELLAEAAITEEENKASLEQWQQREAERQAKAKVKMKRGIQGPFIRYYSYIDGPTNRQLSLRRKLVMLTDDKDGNTLHMDITDPEVLEYHQQRDIEESGIATKNLITFFPDGAGDIHNKTTANEEDPTTLPSNTNKLQHIKADGLTDRELDRLDRIPQLASWADRSPRYVKPLPCPITGKEARYREPRTNTPYATASSYEYIRNCLDHKFIWSPSLGIYTCSEGDSQGADGVPDGWDRMVLGKQPDEEDWVAPLPSWMANTTEAASSASSSHSSEHPSTGKSTRKKNRQRT